VARARAALGLLSGFDAGPGGAPVGRSGEADRAGNAFELAAELSVGRRRAGTPPACLPFLSLRLHGA